MKKLLILSVLFLITGIINAPAQTQRSEIANPSDFRKMDVSQNVPDCRKSLLNCGREAMMRLNLLGFGGSDDFVRREETFRFKNGVGIYLSSILGKRPDSIPESRTRIAFIKQPNGAYRFVQVGEQFRCPGESWSKTPCRSSDFSDNRANDSLVKTNVGAKTALSEVRDLEDFRWITINGRAVSIAVKPCYKSLLECGRERLGLYAYDLNDMPNVKEETFDFYDDRTGKTKGIYLITSTGARDDSVAGERVRIGFEREGNFWRWKQAGVQNQCRRGNYAGRWTKEFCP